MGKTLTEVLDEKKNITLYEEPGSWVSMIIKECSSCKSLEGTYHTKKCKLNTWDSLITKRVDSQYGKITYKDWCEREVLRMKRHNKEVAILERKDGTIAIVRK